MRKRTFLLIGVLVFTLLLTGCTSSGQNETTVPAETTAPPETTLPPETTAPPETTLPAETTVPPTTEPSGPRLEDSPFHESFLTDGFVHYCGEPLTVDGRTEYYLVYYTYAGDSSEIELTTMDAALTLPDGWLDQVYVFRTANPPQGEHIYIISRNLWEAYREGIQEPGSYDGLQDYLLCLSSFPKSICGDPEQYREDRNYLCETEDQVFFVSMAAPEGSPGAMMREALIQKIGQEAYDTLVGDLIVTPEMVSEMITIHGQIDPAAEA